MSKTRTLGKLGGSVSSSCSVFSFLRFWWLWHSSARGHIPTVSAFGLHVIFSFVSRLPLPLKGALRWLSRARTCLKGHQSLHTAFTKWPTLPSSFFPSLFPLLPSLIIYGRWCRGRERIPSTVHAQHGALLLQPEPKSRINQWSHLATPPSLHIWNGKLVSETENKAIKVYPICKSERKILGGKISESQKTVTIPKDLQYV